MAIGSALSVGLIGLKAFIIQIRRSYLRDSPTFPSSDFPTPRSPKRGTCQIRMSGQRCQMAGNTGYGQSFAGVHAQTRILTRSGDRSERA